MIVRRLDERLICGHLYQVVSDCTCSYAAIRVRNEMHCVVFQRVIVKPNSCILMKCKAKLCAHVVVVRCLAMLLIKQGVVVT